MSITIALAGNPNCGKTTMFNDLTGSNQYVGNWPGVTVEKKEGRLKGHKDVVIQDLPGIYSLSPYTLEEVVARGFLVKEKPDAIINILDGTNVERNLYLTTQLLELGIPVVVALNKSMCLREVWSMPLPTSKNPSPTKWMRRTCAGTLSSFLSAMKKWLRSWTSAAV